MTRRIVVAAIASVFAFRALAHEVACDEAVGLLGTDPDGKVKLDPDGSPLFTAPPRGAVTVDTYPAVVGWQLRIRNVAQQPATVTDVQAPVLQGGAGTVHRALPGVPFAIPVGGAVTSVVEQRIASFDACLALAGAPADAGSGGAACANHVEDRLAVTTETDVAECRARLVCGAAPPPAPCATGQSRCGEACVDTSSDAANCGACGNACAPGTICQTGACATPTCPGSGNDRFCGSGCVDVTVDPKNCGACGNVCPWPAGVPLLPGGICALGECLVPPTPCPEGQTFCQKSHFTIRPAGCFDLQTETFACGSCDVFCHSLAQGLGTCVAGKCVFPP